MWLPSAGFRQQFLQPLESETLQLADDGIREAQPLDGVRVRDSERHESGVLCRGNPRHGVLDRHDFVRMN